jgi:hypothetical protein
MSMLIDAANSALVATQDDGVMTVDSASVPSVNSVKVGDSIYAESKIYRVRNIIQMSTYNLLIYC